MKETQPTRFSIENVGTLGTRTGHTTHRCFHEHASLSQHHTFIGAVFPDSAAPFSKPTVWSVKSKQFTWPHRRQTTSSSSNDTARSGSLRFSLFFFLVSERDGMEREGERARTQSTSPKAKTLLCRYISAPDQ